MEYNEALEYIHSLLKFGIKPGLERINALLSELGNPQNCMKFLHIAGTNGKGTTSTMLSEILTDSGYRTGLFTSPYVFDFCERIKIDSENISHADLCAYTERVKKAAENIAKNGFEVTEFEFITALALLYYKEKNCDYVVLEVGLGGRLDSTNAIPSAEVCVITSVALDHINILGNTVEEIAYEKCGIIKKNSKVVTTSLQNKKALEVIKESAERTDSELRVADFGKVNIIDESIKGTKFEYKGTIYKTPLAGIHQVENTLGVIEAARFIKGVNTDNIQRGLRRTVMHGRMELVEENVLIDGGHNEECALALKAVIEKYLAGKKITAVIGMMADKDCEKYLANILPLCDGVVFTRPDNPRSESPGKLTEIAKKYIKKITLENSPKIAYYRTKEYADFVLVCGSFYLISDVFS